MGNQASRQDQAYSRYKRRPDAYGSPYGYQGEYGIATPGELIREPWAVTQWTEYYIPTVRGGGRRPVIYIAAPLPAGLAGYGGVGGFGGLGGGYGGLGGGYGGVGGGLGGFGHHHHFL